MIPTIESLNYKEFTKIYHKYMVKDFPKNELRPLFMFRHLFRNKRYLFLVMKEQETVLGYACLIQDPNLKVMLLDYFAITKTIRSKGYGSIFIQELHKYMDVDGILIESELPYKAKSEAEALTRSKRVAFYQNNGADLLDYEWRAFGVDYHLLYLPFKKNTNGHFDDSIHRLYTQAMPNLVVKLFTKLEYKKNS